MNWKAKWKGHLIIGLSKWFPQAYYQWTIKHAKRHSVFIDSALQKPLNESCVAILTSAGVHLNSDSPFLADASGDYSYRIIPSSTSEKDLEVSHLFYDTNTAKKDISIVFPLEALKKAAEIGNIKKVSDTHIGINGGTSYLEPHQKETAPKIAKILKKAKADIVLLVPGCGYCHNILGLYARELEMAGLRTAMVSVIPNLAEEMKIPRTLQVPFKIGRTCGEPFDSNMRQAVVDELLILSQKPAGTIRMFLPEVPADSASKTVIPH